MNRPALVLLLAVATFALAPVARAGRTRAVCPYAAGALPVETLPAGRPHGDQIPIDHIVVLMQENRSFDHMLGKLFEEGQPNAAGLRGIHANPDPLGTHVISSFHQTRYCEVADLAHSWSRTHAEWNGGLMNGFPAANAVSADPHGSRAMGYYTSADLPFYYALYATFAMGDHYFASVLGPTYPNRLYLLAGTSFGHTSNDAPSPRDEYSPSIFDRMNAAGVDWRVYYGGLPFSAFLSGAAARPANLDPIDQFYADAAAGMLPPVSFVEPAYFGGLNEENDEHPPANVQVGQQFVAGVVQALFASPNWPHTAMFLTYDEHGGFYDHVPPPPACIPDD
jgi:phospholipase C